MSSNKAEQAAGIRVGSKHPDEARTLLQFLASPAAQPTVSKTGLDSIAH
ncbi:substrate-binding domain-containing protein [Paraburkholderia phymatum]